VYAVPNPKQRVTSHNLIHFIPIRELSLVAQTGHTFPSILILVWGPVYGPSQSLHSSTTPHIHPYCSSNLGSSPVYSDLDSIPPTTYPLDMFRSRYLCRSSTTHHRSQYRGDFRAPHHSGCVPGHNCCGKVCLLM
jgi:hypothetical protein